MRKLRRPTGGLWSHTRLPQALGRPDDQRVRLAGLAARDPLARGGRPAREPARVLRSSACSASSRSSSSRSPPASGSTACARRPILIVGDAARAILLLATSRSPGRLGILDIWQLLVLAVRDRDLHRLLRRRVPVVSPVPRRPRPAHRRELEAAADRLGRADRRARARRAASSPRSPRRTRSSLDAVSFVLSTLFMSRIRAPETIPERSAEAPRRRCWPEREGRASLGRRATATCARSRCARACRTSSASSLFAIVLLYCARTLPPRRLGDGARVRRLRLDRLDRRRPLRQPPADGSRRRRRRSSMTAISFSARRPRLPARTEVASRSPLLMLAHVALRLRRRSRTTSPR